MLQHALFAAALLASATLAQVPIPPHSTVYNGFSRGFNFVSNTNFTIGQLELPVDAFLAGDTAGFLVRINGATAFRSVGNTSAIVVTNIAVASGDVVDIIGNWSPAVTGNFTAHNSYTATGLTPYATTINGVPHTLTRCGWQWDIGDPTWVDTGATGAYLAPVAGQMGRINVYDSVGGTVFATNTTLGQGCVSAADVSSYENFAAGSFDLTNTAMTWLRTPTGYLAIPGLTTFVPPSGTAQVLTLTDDSETTVTLSAPMPIGASGTTATLTVCSNGFISSGAGNGTTFTPTPATFLAGPRHWWSLAWHDLNPVAAGGGQVKFEEVAGIAYITWDGVWDFNGTTAANANTFQAQFDVATGTVHIVYQTMSNLGNGYLVGFSDAGASADPGSMDISAALPTTYNLATFAVLPVTLTATNRPIQQAAINNWNLTVSNLPTIGLVLNLFGAADPNIPDLSLLNLGRPTCQLRSTLDIIGGPTFITGPTVSYSLTIPPTPSLLNLQVFTQAAVLALPLDLTQTLTSNGIRGTIGDF
jgi:hypothetical protein